MRAWAGCREEEEQSDSAHHPGPAPPLSLAWVHLTPAGWFRYIQCHEIKTLSVKFNNKWP